MHDVRGTLGFTEDDMKAHAYNGYTGGDVRAGDRAPDVPALVGVDGAETALFMIFKSYYHTLFVFVPERANIAGIIKAAQAYPEGLARTRSSSATTASRPLPRRRCVP